MSAERMNQLNNELRDLCAELDCLQARAFDDIKNNFLTMCKLITRV